MVGGTERHEPSGSGRAERPERGTDRLTDKAVRAFVARAKAGTAQKGKLFDGEGLYLLVTAAGTPVWRLKYRHGGKERVLALGVYPTVGLASARGAREAARDQLRDGRDPMQARRVERVRSTVASESTFAGAVEAWLTLRREDWSAVHYATASRALERDVLPALGPLPIGEITSPMIAAVILPIAKRGAVETAKKTLWNINRVFRLAKTAGLIADNPAVDVAEILPRRVKKSRRPALLELDALRDILRRSDLVPISPAVRLASKLIAYTACRPGNVVSAEWSQFDLDAKPPAWVIPRSLMKRRDDRAHDHKVILGPTIAQELRAWRHVTGKTQYVFPSPAKKNPHIVVEALDRAYSRTLGLAGKHSPHGWRAAFKTLALELGGFSRDATELALDHIHDTDVVRAYDRGERLEERIRMARWWDEQLSGTPTGA